MDTKEHKPQQQHKIKQERNDGIVLLFLLFMFRIRIR